MPFEPPLLTLLPNTRAQVNVPAESGEMGILPQHVPSIEQLKPGLVEIIEETGGNRKQFFRRSPTQVDNLIFATIEPLPGPSA